VTLAEPVQTQIGLPPLSLYVHLPWCVSKCPYCDFNSHKAPERLPREEYFEALLMDIEADLPLVWGRPVGSVFFGGGTPSLFDAEWIGELLSRIRGLLPLRPDTEITLEANPGTIEYDSFSAYRDVGINRVSVGVQSFDDGLLARIGRIHAGDEARVAIESIHKAGIENFNIDLMFGLPGQSLTEAIADIKTALSMAPAHLSHYQLTLEPNTAFAANPPGLPAEDDCWKMQSGAAELLSESGLNQYEISAWSVPGQACRHNLNYWHYGDFLGVGAGAHAKLTDTATQKILRISKHRHPRQYLAARDSGEWRAEVKELGEADRLFEFFLNQLRLREGVSMSEFSERTGLPRERAAEGIGKAVRRGLLRLGDGQLLPTELGWRFVNETQQLFLD
jgi:oxygen-independent coproporphyrinogen-3 oxidase